ncbi:GAF domain-containing protein [Lentzea sp. JNUCC 0626]|uniref:GAF domain-containing protein n=1 Tax=Lentzea sp. JNUCC 0626 TaxID=3367513 RepID=UPI00374A622F
MSASGLRGYDLRALFGQSTTVFAAFTGPSHEIETANESFTTLFGDGGSLADLLDDVRRTGESRTDHDVRVVVGTGEDEREAFFDLTCEPRADLTGVRVIGVETTQVRNAQRLMADHRALLVQIARQAPLADVLDGMTRCIEDLAPRELVASVLLAAPDGTLRHGAAPSLPDFYNEAIDGIATGEGIGSCGTAAHRREPVITADIATDPLWTDFRHLAEQADLRACWSTPILAGDGTLLGTFAMYHRTPRTPKDTDRALIQIFADTAALAIERHHAEAAERADRMREAAVAQSRSPHPERCELGGRDACAAPAEIKVADSWGDAAWGCAAHVEEVLIHVRSVFIASEELGGLGAYLDRRNRRRNEV